MTNESTDAFEAWLLSGGGNKEDIDWDLYGPDQEIFQAGWDAAMAARVRAVVPNEDVVAKKAIEICANIPETVTQGAAKERATRAFYEWFIEQIRIEQIKAEEILPTKEENRAWEKSFELALLKQVKNEEIGLDQVEDILVKGYQGFVREYVEAKLRGAR